MLDSGIRIDCRPVNNCWQTWQQMSCLWLLLSGNIGSWLGSQSLQVENILCLLGWLASSGLIRLWIVCTKPHVIFAFCKEYCSQYRCSEGMLQKSYGICWWVQFYADLTSVHHVIIIDGILHNEEEIDSKPFPNKSFLLIPLSFPMIFCGLIPHIEVSNTHWNLFLFRPETNHIHRIFQI